MARRYPALPTLWLMTDERQGAALWSALATLPRGSGVVFRHHGTEAPARSALFARIGRVARRRGLVLAAERLSPQGGIRMFLSVRQRAPGKRGRGGAADWIARVHDRREAASAERAGATAMFLSAIFATRTHPGQTELGPLRAGRIARAAHIPVIALGGMTAPRFRRVRGLGFYGWAAIDGLTPKPEGDQKRKAVPI